MSSALNLGAAFPLASPPCLNLCSGLPTALLPKESDLVVDLQGSAPVPACDKGLPVGRAGPLQVNYIVSGSKLQQKWTVPHSRELSQRTL